jgi:hypothetical protein
MNTSNIVDGANLKTNYIRIVYGLERKELLKSLGKFSDHRSGHENTNGTEIAPFNLYKEIVYSQLIG